MFVRISILLDIMLPDSDGLDICKGIRNDAELAQTPIIFLTARASETDRIVGLELGANDYIVKPFFIRELIARIKLQFRTQTAPARVLKAGDVELDRSSCQVKLRGRTAGRDGDRVPAAGVSDDPAGRGFQPRAVAERGLGTGSRDYGSHGGRLHPAAAAEDREAIRPLRCLIHSVRGFGYSFEPRGAESRREEAVLEAAS